MAHLNYDSESSVEKYLPVAHSLHSLATYVSSPAPAALHSAEVGGAASVWLSPLL